MTWYESLIDFVVKNGLIPQLLLLILVWGTLITLVAANKESPSWLQDAGLTILGYFFHVTTDFVSKARQG